MVNTLIRRIKDKQEFVCSSCKISSKEIGAWPFGQCEFCGNHFCRLCHKYFYYKMQDDHIIYCDFCKTTHNIEMYLFKKELSRLLDGYNFEAMTNSSIGASYFVNIGVSMNGTLTSYTKNFEKEKS